ncbi:MAG: aminotransferase class III-fold pyridoxal phosphate-dependent enzyme, partial [Methyloprofundus sp.]|nr:aminotransferase class III-fold pyridoxal phosphate-dependent enzyme [Methyloprofundus sp.]
SLAPVGPVYQAGTLSGNPVAMAAGHKTLELLSASNFHEELAAKTRTLVEGIQAKAIAANIGMSINIVGSMFGLFFTQDDHISTFEQVMRCDQELFKQFFHGMLQEGIYLAPSAFEAGFVSAAHSDEDIAATIAAAERVLNQL